MQQRNRVNRIINLVLMTCLSIIILVPFWFMIVSSFKSAADIFSNGLNIKLDLSQMSFKNYIKLFTHQDAIFWVWFKNSVVITGVTTILVLIFTSMVGYGLALYRFKGRTFIFIMVLVMMMVPRDILLLPLYKLMSNFGLMDTYAGVVLPGIVPVTAIFFFRQYCLGLSTEYAEAARIDGCGEAKIFTQIYVPLMKPAFGAMTILTAMGSWNDFLWPLIVMNSDRNFTLPAGLMSAMTPYGNNYDILFAGSVMSIIPIVIIFLFNQKSFINGLTIGGVKG